MRRLFNYITEACFANKDFSISKHGGKYAINVMTAIASGKDIKLGPRGEELVPARDMESFCIPEKMKELLDKTIETGKFDINEFNHILSPLKTKYYKIQWNNIYKDAQAYDVKGGGGRNRGIGFETFFINHWNEFYPILKKAGIDDLPISNEELKHVGGANNSRKLLLDGDKLIITPNDGVTIADVIASYDGINTYLSLKSGSTLAALNAGVNNKQWFPANKDGKGFEIGPWGEQFINDFHIDKEKFHRSFLAPEYRGVDSDEIVDVTGEVGRNKNILEFCKSVFGYNYVYIHMIKPNGPIDENNIHIINIGNDGMPLGRFKKCEIRYPSKSYRVEIRFEFENINFNLTFRNKSDVSTERPSHMNVEYKIVK